MGSLDRKIRRKREKEKKKKSQKVMKEVGELISSMPKTCRSCGAELDTSDHESLDKWRIKIFESGRVELTCGDCAVDDDKSEVTA